MHTPITYLKGAGPTRATLLKKELGLKTYADLIHFFPFRYIDRTLFFKTNELHTNNSEVQIIGQITSINTVKQKRGSRLVAKFSDEFGNIELVWFQGAKWIATKLKLKTTYVVFGKVTVFNGKFTITHPELELQSEYNKSLRTAMQPVYPSTEILGKKGVSNRVLFKMMQNLFLETKGKIKETLSLEIIDKLNLVSKKEALFNIHFPKNQEDLSKAQFRLKFEEFFYIQLQLIRKNMLHKSKFKSFKFNKVGTYFNYFYKNNLTFELTNAQKRVLKEIRNDLNTGAQMNRLLQGDVGSGKTIVALLSMLIALDNNFQTALIAPTTILASQHYESISALLLNTNIKVALLTGATKTKARRLIHETLENGELHILIGTHAILQDKVQFKNIGLAVIDEQHRFGVAQRSKMWLKNKLPPHILVMTATPIPRTLAMSVYGDLDISVIDELPPGRKDIKTVHRYDKNRLSVFKFLKDEIVKGRQVYIVYPLIQESEVMDYKDLMDGYESISRDFPRPDYQISIVHGKMKPEAKALEMERFVKRKTQIMVATTVIEVGVNIPNASVMVIESAERFGLSQLHQLRGRVGRGGEQSYCILMSSFKLSADAKLRLKTMTQTNDGFKIAEVDLQLRGPGNLMGTQQSGVLNLKIANIVKDTEILKLAREFAIDTLKKDANLNLTENNIIKNTFFKIMKTQGVWSNIS
ncbi:MAG: ATP-dependent DNA helicase RecG [Flavobacteriaceae bacterium]|nr:ATP-dependent DNA helicase RecG [Flavobacteriaceae bacterium]